MYLSHYKSIPAALDTLITHPRRNPMLPRTFAYSWLRLSDVKDIDMSHVLLVDDSEKIRNTVKLMLESAGFDVTLAIDGEDAVNQFREERFDLVISDIVMPRKDGLQAIRELREMTPDIPIVAMSGVTHFSSGMCGQETSYALTFAEVFGATRTISKPFSRDDLLTVIRESMSETASRAFDERAP
jgi:two-component system, chemotaxis family, chemotaxis protein CheY